MSPGELADKIEFVGVSGSITLLGGWELDERAVRRQIVEQITAAVAAEREFWEKLVDEARGALAEVALADDLGEDGRRKKAKAHYDRIVRAIEERERVSSLPPG